MKDLVPFHIRNLVPYESAKSINITGNILLNANELPWKKEIFIKNNLLNRYPDFQPIKLIQRYSNYVKLKFNNILATRGADEAIELLIKSFCTSQKDSIMITPPTYDMYRVSATILNIKVVSIPLNKNFQLNCKEILNNLVNIKLIYLCNPNNPTGNILFKHDVEIILKKLPLHILLIIDEAYIEFSSKNSFIYLLAKHSNLIILRTLSKAFGLAGIRCGFILSNAKLIKILRNVLNPYPIPTPTSSIAITALHKNNIVIMKRYVSLILKYKKYLINKISQFYFVKCIYPSNANFILVKFINAKLVFTHLLKYGIILRDQSNKYLLKNCLRISVGTQLECQSLINIFLILEQGRDI